MAGLKELVNRVLPPKYEHPAPPVEAEARFPSHIFSADDDVAPSSRLLEAAYAGIEAAANRVDLEEIAQRPRVPEFFTCWPGEHYRLLAGLVQAIGPKVVVEFATGDGLAALAMKPYLPEGGRLVTFDRERWDMRSDTLLSSGDFEDVRFKQEVGDLASPGTLEQHQTLLREAELILIDDRADGEGERLLVEHLRTIEFRKPPLVVCDDTRLWSMLKFWRELPYPKLDLTSFGHWSGTGMFELV